MRDSCKYPCRFALTTRGYFTSLYERVLRFPCACSSSVPVSGRMIRLLHPICIPCYFCVSLPRPPAARISHARLGRRVKRHFGGIDAKWLPVSRLLPPYSPPDCAFPVTHNGHGLARF